MVRPLQIVEIGGRRVEMLFTPSLYSIAARKGVSLVVEDTTDFAQIAEAYQKIMYLAAINAWEVRLFDNPELGDFDMTLMDFAEWAAAEPKMFGKYIGIAVEALTGKAMGAPEEGAPVKKKLS